MHLVYIANTGLPTQKARGVQIMKSCEAFAGRGLEVVLLVPRTRNTLGEDPFSYYHVRRTFRIERQFCFGAVTNMVARFSERAAFYFRSIVFSVSSGLSLLKFRSHDSLFYSRDFIPLFCMALANVAYIAEVHDYRSRVPRWYIKFLLRRARHIVVNSEGTRQALGEHYDTRVLPISVVPNGVDPDYFNVPETKEEARKMLGIAWDGPMIGYVGRLETVGKEKGISELLSAFKAVSVEYPQAMLAIVGGPNEFVEMYREHAFGYPIIFTGQISYRDIPHYLRAMDMLIIPLPNNQHGRTTSPMKLFEYMAAGKPIVASDLPSIRLHLNEHNAFLFTAGSTAAMADAMMRILREPEDARKRSVWALEDSRRYTWSERARVILDTIA